MKGAGMIVVPLRGVNFGFLFHLGCSGQNVIIFSPFHMGVPPGGKAPCMLHFSFEYYQTVCSTLNI